MSPLETIPNQNAIVILSLALILFTGFLMTRITKKIKLPDVTGYIFAGILLGPCALNLIPPSIIEGMDFITDIASAYIAFSVGKYFKVDKIKEHGKKIVVITLFEALLSSTFIFVVMYFCFGLPLSFALMLAAIASATSSASTIMIIRQYRAKGQMVDIILQIIALDNVIALIAFSICTAITGQAGTDNGFLLAASIRPVLLNLLVIAVGGISGYLLKWIISAKRTREHSLILINAVILALGGLCTALNVSPLLAGMLMGMVYANVRKDKKLFKDVNYFSAPIMLMFFALSGMKLNIPILVAAGGIGLTYFAVRIVGKCLGAFAGSSLCKLPGEIGKYLGLALVPQTSVAIGLAALGQRLLPEESGVLLSTIILSSGILYEIVGPACAKAALSLSNSIEKVTKK